MIRQFVLDEFVSQFGLALEMVAGERPSIAVQPATEPPRDPVPVVWEQRFSPDGCVAWITGPVESWTAAGLRLLSASGVDNVDAATAKSTVLEVIKQSFAGVAHAAGERLQKQITTAAATELPELPAEQNWNELSMQFRGSPPQLFWIAFSQPLRELVPASAVAHDRPSKAVAARGVSASIENSKTLDLLLDVELPLSVSFGRAQLSLKEVIKLTTGSIVELNRTIGEPVEIIVNNCVIARGEVVVVEGNFGVRIQHVISKQDRLRTLY